MSIDYESDELWWISQSRNISQIMFCKIGNFTGANFCIPKNFTSRKVFEHLSALVVDNANVYYSQDGSRATVEMISKDGRNNTLLRTSTPGVTAMKLYFEDRLSSGK